MTEPDAMSPDPLAIVIRDAIDTVPVAAAATYVAGQPCSDAMVEHVLAALHAAGYRVVRVPVVAAGECGADLGKRLAIVNGAWQKVPYTCSKPAKFKGDDGVMRCVQHDRMSRGLSGKWTNPAAPTEEERQHEAFR